MDRKTPCKKCLVQAMCQNSYECDMHTNWTNKTEKYIDSISSISFNIFLYFFICFWLFVTVVSFILVFK